jgi:glycosyltransferase involved in cell wall biosynthesis
MDDKKVRIAFLARCDDTGLGNESMEFVEHIKPDKVLKVLTGDKPQHPERFEGKNFDGIPDDDTIKELLTDVDVLFCIETPYNHSTFSIARKMGVKTILRVNFEYLAPFVGYNAPDLWISPVDWNMEWIPQPNIVLPFPVNTDKIKFRERKVAKTFLHIAGNRGYMDRNGTNIVLDAIPLLKSEAKIIIKDQRNMPEPEYEHLYDEGDVLLYPRRHSGQSLVMNEAMAAGLPIMMTDMAPQNTILPKEMLIPVKRMGAIDIRRRIEFAEIDPIAVAEKVDELYNQSIWLNSKLSRETALAMSWQKLLPEYQRVFQELYQPKKKS